MTTEEKNKMLFDAIDKDKSGGINLAELQSALKDLRIGEERLNKLFQTMDLDKDGCLDFKEFVGLVLQVPSLPHSLSTPHPPTRSRHGEPTSTRTPPPGAIPAD